jgi:sugar phosphate permease
MTGLYMGQALGGFGATMASAFSWQTAFHSFGLAGVAYALVLAIFLREKRDNTAEKAAAATTPKKSMLQGFAVLFSNISFWIILFYFAAPSLPGWGVKNWLPTLFASSLNIDMAQAGPISTITIAVSSLLGVLFGGILSDRWVQRHIRGRIFTSAIGLGLTIPALVLIGLGTSLPSVVGAAFCFGFGFGMFDANNMPIVCQFVAPAHRATAYGLMNMCGVFAGAAVTAWLGKSTDAGSLGSDFALLGGLVAAALLLQLLFLKPRHHDFEEQSNAAI